MNGNTPQRIRRSRDQWQQLISEQAASDMTQSAFCRARSLSLASFQNWKRRLAAETPAEPWVELGTLSQAGGPGWDIELTLGDGICLRLRRC
jgi:hypothetical protein